MSLQPTKAQPKEDLWGDAGVDNDVAKWYEMNPNKGIDLSRADAKEHWEKLVEGMNKRHTDWLEIIGETGAEIAKLPAHLVEGIVEDPNPIKVVGGAAEGVVRSLRDMWGMFAESENPTSPLFKFKSAIGAITSGKISKNWQEEAQQWNHARRYLWDSNKIMQGDMSVYEALPYVNMDNDTAETLRSLRNPKVAHAMSFLGLELGSMVAAPFTGGASAALGVAGATNMAAAGARTAARASAYARVMGTLTDAGKKLDSLAHGAALRTTGTMATAASKAISIPANMVEGLVGGNIDAIAGRAGINSAHARNMAQTQAINGLADIGAGEVRQTVGYLGSLGLRTTAELLGEFGEQATLLADGVITADQINGLTVIERVAGNKLMSRSAQNAAKAINVTVDPVLQMSTAALKHAYKDSLFFAGLGYMNDRERGMVGGATMGMVWGGYSGAFRHLWANVSGAFQHENYIRDFDTQFMPKIDSMNPELGSFFRKMTTDVDRAKSTRASSNVRYVAQMMHLIMDPNQKRKAVGSALPAAEVLALLESKGLSAQGITKDARGSFFLAHEASSGEMVPVVWMNPDIYRPTDFGHEVLSHLLVYNLTERGQLGRHLLEYFGTGENKGIRTDKFMAETAAIRNSLEIAIEQLGMEGVLDGNPQARSLAQERAKQIYAADANTVGSVKYFEGAIKQLRTSSYGSEIASFEKSGKDGQPLIYSEAYIPSVEIARKYGADGVMNPLKYMFEEFVAGHAENMFVHTNLQDLSIPDSDRPLRMYFERKFIERLSRVSSEMELAGIRAKHGPIAPDGRPTIQAEIYDDGVYRRHPEADNLLKNMIQSARSLNDAPVHQLSPEMQLAVAKKHRKEFLFNISGNGATFKGEKERNDMSAKSAEGAFKVFDSLPDELKPKFTVDEHGNRSADVYTMKDEVLDALVTSGYLDAESARIAKAFRDTYLGYESSGFTSPNMFYGQALNASHRTVTMGNLFKRIFGEDVPVTHRVFVPFELKVSLRTTDSQGRPLRKPRGGFLTTVVDYTAIHRRQLKMWSRADVKALFTNIGEFNEFFHVYMMNMLREPSARVDSATLFRPKFGANAEKVRDIMYETFGASKRKDESYFNAPREGYFSDHEDPNFPIHSMRLENLIGVEKLSASPFPYHHGRSYEPLRRNLSTAGFEEISANVFASGQGYRVIRERSTSGGGWKVFSPFGGLVGRYNEKDKAFKAAQKHLRKSMNPADILSLPSEEGWEQMSRPERLRAIQQESYRANGVQARKSTLLNNVSLSLAPIRDGGREYKPVWSDDFKIFNLITALFSKDGTPFSFRDLIENNGELNSYQESNRIGFNLGNVRILPNQVGGYGVKSKYSGKAVKLMPHYATGERVVYVDADFYSSFSKNDAKDFLLQDIQSEIQHIGEATGRDSVANSYMQIPAENGSLRMFGSYMDAAVVTDAALTAFESGKPSSGAVQSSFLNSRKTLVDSASFKELLSATDVEGVDNAVRSIVADKSIDPKVSSAITDIVMSFVGNKRGRKKGADEKRKVLQGLLRHAEGMMFPKDKEAQVIEAVNGLGEKVYAILTTSEVVKHQKEIQKIIEGLGPEERYQVSVGLSKAFLHWAPQIASKGDLENPNVSRLDAVNPKNQGAAELTNMTFTSSQIGRDVSQAMFILPIDQNAFVYSPAGMIIVLTPDGKTAVRGGSDAGGRAPQPIDAMRSRPNLGEGRGNVAQQDAKIADVLRGTWFGKNEINGKLYDLAMDIISKDKSKDDVVMQVWSSYLSNNNHVEAARAFHDLANSTKEQGLRHMAQATLGLALATDQKSMEARFNERYGQSKDGDALTRARELFPTVFWDEAVAEYNISAQTYWNVGMERTQIERIYESSLSSKFHNKFGQKGQVLEQTLKKHRDINSRFFSLAEKNNTFRSVAGVDSLSSERRTEVIKAGLAKEMLFNGKRVLAFEFSDAEAYLDTSSVEGQPHMLPFAGMPDAEKAFADYAFEVKRRAADDRLPKYISRSTPIGRDTTLGKVFGHDSMYYYYPEMKDVKVRWYDGHGGSAVRLMNDEYVIELGIRSFASAALNVKHDIDGMVFNDHTSLSSRFVATNPLASIVLHEAQHVLQEKAGWMNENGHIMNINREVVLGHYANLLGIRSNFSLSEQIGKSIAADSLWSDADKTAARDVAELANRLALANESPVVRELNMRAGHLMKSAIRNFAGIIASEADAGRIDREVAKRVLALQSEVSRAESPSEYLSAYKNMMKVREQVRRTNAQYSIKSHFDVEFRAATSALGLVRSVVAMEHSTPEQRALLIRQSLEDYIDLNYLIRPEERMARETEDRRMLTQSELAEKPRKYTSDVLPEGSVMGIIANAIGKSDVITPSQLMEGQTRGLDAFEAGRRNPVHVVMQSIGGIGEKAEDSQGFAMMGKLSLVRHILARASDELTMLNRFVIAERGWAVEDGRIVLRTGNYVVEGNYEDAVRNFSQKFNTKHEYNKYNQSESSSYIVPFETKESGTYTMAEILEIAGAKVASEDVLTLGNSLMDLVASDEFPPMFKVGEIMGMLSGEGDRKYSKEAADAVLLNRVVSSLDKDMVLTKNDLLNIFAYNHHQTRLAYSASKKGFGVGEVVSPEVMARATEVENARKLVKAFGDRSRAFAERTMMSENSTQVFTYESKDFSIGRFTLTGTEYKFSVPSLEAFIHGDADKAAVVEIKKRIANGLSSRYQRETIEQVGGMSNHDFARRLNHRLERMSYMIKPMLMAFADNMLRTGEQDKSIKSKMALLMLTEIEKSLIRTTPWDGIGGWDTTNANKPSYIGTSTGSVNGQYATGGANRVYGKTSILSDFADMGGTGKGDTYQLPFASPSMPSLRTLSGSFMLQHLGEMSDANTGFSRVETALEFQPSGNRSGAEMTAVGNLGYLDRVIADRNIRSVEKDGGAEAIGNTLVTLHNNWSTEDSMGNIVTRLNDALANGEEGLVNIEHMINEVKGFKDYLSDSNFEWDDYSFGTYVKEELARGVAAGLTKEQSIDALADRLEIKKAEHKARYADMAKVMQMQLDELRAAMPMHPLHQQQGSHQTGLVDYGLMIRTATTKRTNTTGVSIITQGKDSFVDVDVALADSDAPTTVTLESFNTSNATPRHVIMTANKQAFNMEAKVTGMFGGSIYESPSAIEPMIAPAMRYDVEMDFITRSIYNMDGVLEAPPSNIERVLDGTMFLSQNVFASLHNDAGGEPLVQWALSNRRDQIQADYNTGGVFDGMARQSQDPILHPHGMRINRTVLGNLVAPYIMSHDIIGFPEAKNGVVMQIRGTLEAGPYHELVAMAETADMRDRTQANAFNELLGQWFLLMDKNNISRLLYEASSVPAVDGVMLRLNILQGVKMSKVRPERSAEFIRAVNEGATFGYDHLFGDSEIYKTQAKQGLPADVIKYVSEQISSQGMDQEFWRGYFFGLAAMKKTKTRSPRPHGYRRDGKLAVTVQGQEPILKIRRNLEKKRRSKSYGMDVDGIDLESIDNNDPVIGSLFGGNNTRVAFKDNEPANIKRGIGYATGVRPEEVDMYTAIFDMAVRQISENDLVDIQGAFGVKDAWLNSEISGTLSVGTSTKGKYALGLKTRKANVSARVRRELIVSRLASIASAMGKETLSVQPARFSAARRQSLVYVGLPTEARRADTFYNGHMQTNSWTGLPFDSSLAAERDKPKVGFAWTRLEDGRIMLNISPNTDVSGYFDGVFSDNYVNALGYSHRRTLGWDVQSKTLIPQSAHYALPIFGTYSTEFKNKAGAIQTSVARLMDFGSAPVLKQHELAAKAMAKRALLGRLGGNSRVSGVSSHLSTDFFGQGVKSIAKIREGNEALDFASLELSNPEHVGQYTDLSDLLMSSSPENSYSTIILPKNATLEDIQTAYFTMAAYHSMALKNQDKMQQIMRMEHFLRRGESDNPWSGQLSWGGAMSKDNVTAFTKMLKMHEEQSLSAPKEGGMPSLKGYKVGETAHSGYDPTPDVNRAANQLVMFNPQLLSDIGRLSERLTSSDSGYYMPDVERGIAMNGDRSAVIGMLMPDQPHLERYAWDSSKKHNLTIIRKSDKSGYMVGHDVVSGVTEAGMVSKTRKVMAFRTEAEANKYRDTVLAGGVEAEVPAALFREGEYQLTEHGAEKAYGPKSGKADVYAGLTVSDEFIDKGKAETTRVYTNEGKFYVGNIDTPFDTKAAAQAAQAMLLKPESITGKAPQRRSVSLSTGGVGQFEHDIRRGLQFGIGGSYIQFAPRALNVLRTALVPMLEKNKHGATKKVKKATEIATGNEWYEMFVENAVSKNEMRVLGLAEFLYDNKDNKLTKMEVAKFLWAMYPQTGRRSDEMPASPYLARVNSPSKAVASAATRFHREREKHLRLIEEEIESAAEEEKGQMVAYLATVRKMHDEALRTALEQFYEKEAAKQMVEAGPEGAKTILESASKEYPRKTLETEALSVDNENFVRPKGAGEVISEPVLETYRHVFNDAFAKARLEAVGRLAGFDFEIPDFRSSTTHLDVINDWGASEEKPVIGLGNKTNRNEIIQADLETYPYNIQYNASQPDYAGYTSGVGQYGWDTLHTSMGLEKANAYIANLKRMRERVGDNAEEAARMDMQIASIERIMKVKSVAQSRMGNSGHKNTPRGTMQLGHARHSDVIVTAYHRANANLTEVGNSLSMSRDTIAALGIEELQSDRYQGSTFGPHPDAFLGSDFKSVENSKLFAELKTLREQVLAERDRLESVADPLKYVQSSVKSKHKTVIRRVIADREIRKATPLLLYAIAINKGLVGEENGIILDTENTHKVSPETARKYGLKDNNIPTVVFTENYEGALHESMLELIYQEENGQLHYGAMGEVYGFGMGQVLGLASTTLDNYWHYMSENSTDNLVRYIASVGLQFNPEFMGKLDWLGEYYKNELDYNDAAKHGVNFDKIALESILDFRRRVERFEARTPQVKEWKMKTLVGLKRAEELYYEPAHLLTDFRNRRDLHSKIHEPWQPEAAHASQIRVDYKRPYRIESQRITNIASDTERYVRMEDLVELGISPDDIVQNQRKLMAKMHYMEYNFVELTPAQAVAMDIRLIGRVLGVTAEQAAELMAKRDSARSYINETYLKALTKPEEITFPELERLGDYGMKVIQAVDIDFDNTSGNPVSRTRGSQHTESRTLLGKMFEMNAAAVTAVYRANIPDPVMERTKARIVEIETLVGKVDADAFTYPDTIPLGEDGAYRGVMTNWYVMRALQNRKDALVVMDARHHRKRYDSNRNIVGLFNLGGGIIAPINISGFKYSEFMAAGYIMHEAKKRTTHGGFLEALHNGNLHQIPHAEEFLSNERKITWNNVEGLLEDHLIESAREIIEELPMFTSGKTAVGMRAAVKSVIDLALKHSYTYRDSNQATLKGLVKATRSGARTPESIFEQIKSSGITDSADVAKRVATHIAKPQGVFLSVPVGRTHGYATNYGAPLWHNKIYYAGMHDALVNQVSHDAFETPDIVMVDGKYSIIDKKTGKPLAEGIVSFNEAQEKAAQNAKYLGAVPIVSNFLKSYKGMGAYAMEAFMLTGHGPSPAADTMSNKLFSTSDARSSDRQVAFSGMKIAGGMAGAESGNLQNQMTTSFGSKTPTEDFMKLGTNMGLNREDAVHGLFGTDSSDPASTAMENSVAMHAMGLRATSSADEVAAATARMVGFTGPMLVIRPKYPNANHMAEAKKMIVQGIPFMSLRGVDSNQAMTKEAVNMYKFYTNAKSNKRDEEK